MDGKVLNIALVGCGGMAASYRHRYTDIPGARLELLIDANKETAREASAQLSGVTWSTAFEDCLGSDIDIVDISTPNFLHAKQAIAALQAGKHVLLQKPIAPSLEEAEAIVNCAAKCGRMAGMYMSYMDNPLYFDIRKMIEEQMLGVISGIHCRGAHKGGLRMKPNTWRNSLEKTGGGSFIQIALHNVNMIQWLLGSRITNVMAFSKNRMCPSVGGDDVTAAACEFENGVLGTLESAYCADGDILSLYGTNGYVTVIGGRTVELKLEKAFRGNTICYDQPGKPIRLILETDSFGLFTRDNSFDQHVAFVKAVQRGERPHVPVEAGYYDLKIVKAISESAKAKRMIRVDTQD